MQRMSSAETVNVKVEDSVDDGTEEKEWGMSDEQSQ
jgi:hypothetical protein